MKLNSIFQVQMSLSSEIIEILSCPRCKGVLYEFACENCQLNFPIVNDTPILINDENSLFKIADFVESRPTTYKKTSNLKQNLKRLIPSISLGLKTKENLQNFFSQIINDNAKVLIIGGAVAGNGFDFNKIPANITLVETDVAFGDRTKLVCDAHDLPFQNQTFDGVIIQAVLEHILEPNICVTEIYRILKNDGLVYSETPFMQQVHLGKYDFTRFTHLGHRRLFRQFSEIESGAICGTAMALAWSYCYFLQSFFTNKTLGQIAFAFGSLTCFWLIYLDYFLINKPTIYDAASSYYFLGKKSSRVLSDEDLIAQYRGLIR
jgi:SAM-dependent methyltransferase